MTSEPIQIWKTHKYRGHENVCPRCGKDIKWIYDGEMWIPCDTEPVLFILHPDGKHSLVYKKEVLDKCLLYRKGDTRFTGKPLQGHMQHYYSCEFLKNSRRLFASARAR